MSTIEIGVNLTLQQDTTSGNLYYTLNDIQTNLEWPVTIINTTPIALVYTSRLPPIQRVKIIQKLNTQENYEETVTYLKRNQ